MLAAIVRASLTHAKLVLAAAIALLAYGVVAIQRAHYDVFPDFVPPQSTVQTEAPGFVAEQVEMLVTRPLEDVLNGASGVTAVRSESIAGLSVVNVTFAEGSDPYRSRQLVAEKLGEAARRLPLGVGVPVLTPLTSSTMDMLKIGFVSDRLSPLELRELVQWTVRPRLLAVPGVARATIFGGAERRIDVRVLTDALDARGLVLGDVMNAVRAATTVSGGGYVDTAAQRVVIESSSDVHRPRDLAHVPINGRGTESVSLGDVAEISEGAAPRFGDALIMGRGGVLLTMSSQYGANTLEVTRDVERAIGELAPLLEARGVVMHQRLHRPANFIESALAGIQRDLLIGTALIALVLFAFMRDFRTVLVAFVAIPLSLIAAIIVLSALGQSINTMTLGGLAVGLGVVIDDAVIGIENIVRRLRGADGDKRATILDASIEVRAPVLYATFVVALTLLPVLLLTGLQGAFFAPLAASFILATLASLGVAITVTPALSYVLLRDARPSPEPRTLTRLKDLHEHLLGRFCSTSRTAIAITVVGTLVVPIAFASFGAELLPAFRERHYVLQVSAPPGTSVEEMRTLGSAITRDLLAIDGIATVEQQIGRAELGEDTWPMNRSEMHVELERVSGSQETQIQARIRDVLARYKGVQAAVLTFLGDRIGESLSGETAAVAIGVYGGDLDVLDRVAQQIATALRRVRDAADVQTKSSPGTPTLRVQIDQQRLRQRGLVATDVLDTITAAFQGLRVGQVVDRDRIVDVAVSIAVPADVDPEQISALRVKGASGRNVPIDAVCNVSVEEGRAVIAHEGGRRRQVVTANPTTTDVAGFTNRVKVEIARSVELPPGVYLEYAGAAEGERAARRELLLNATVGAFGIVTLLLLAFGDGRAAALVLASAPLAFAGGIVAVFAGGSVLSLGALVGFVTLFGIAARTAILLVAHADHLDTEEGMGWGLQTVLRGARERVTPILMTALVTMLALVPLAVESGETGREVQGPMAIVILGGLLTSTLMGLFVTPALIYHFRYSAHAVARRDIEASAQ